MQKQVSVYDHVTLTGQKTPLKLDVKGTPKNNDLVGFRKSEDTQKNGVRFWKISGTFA